jgi:hypothetical protein
LSVAQDALVRRSATLIALCEHAEVCLLTGRDCSVNEYLQAVTALKRLLCSLGLKRQPRDVTPTLADILNEASPESEGAVRGVTP